MYKSTWIFIAVAWFGWAIYYGWVGEPTAWRYASAFTYFVLIMGIVIRVTTPYEEENDNDNSNR